FRLGSHNDMNFGKGTSSRDTLRGSAKHSVRELPVNWWVQPSVIRTFSSRGDMSMGTAAAGSNMTFSPSQNGTSLDWKPVSGKISPWAFRQVMSTASAAAALKAITVRPH
ncbi:hypothetical protein KJK80_005547, partial [Escherichia coli]|nr:hypothetical protein [Escherichia coli]